MDEGDTTGSAAVLDSITTLQPLHSGKVVVAASHGGRYPAACALKARLAGVILHDAGIGRDRAGVAGLAELDRWAMPAAAIAHLSARIGCGADCLTRGVLSTVNEHAARLGLEIGQTVREALGLMINAGLPAVAGDFTVDEARQVLPGRLVLADSNALVQDGDANCVFVTGSHGGLLGGRPATAIRKVVRAALYNDADGGADGAGYSRLPALADRGIPAVTVSAWSARIGDALSTLEDGYITAANAPAFAWGAEIGMAARRFVERCLDRG